MKRTDLEAEIRRIHEDCWGWALACCGRAEADAEDVLQTAYLKVLEGRARFTGRSSFRTWLFGVIRHTASEQRRRQARREAGVFRGGEGATRPTVQERLEREEEAGRLVALLAELPVRQREVLHLVFYQGLTIAEAGEVLGITVGSARTHYARGKARLREELTREGWR